MANTSVREPTTVRRGKEGLPLLMEEAIRSGNEVSLGRVLANPSFWKGREAYERAGRSRTRAINPVKDAMALAITEFNTWYVRGFARRLIEEGEELCEVYRADYAWEPRAECLDHEGVRYSVRDVYNGHRARYWPEPGNPAALSIPVGTNCHHSIRRIKRARKEP